MPIADTELKTPLVSGAELPPDRPRRGTAANFLGLKTRFGPCAFPPDLLLATYARGFGAQPLRVPGPAAAPTQTPISCSATANTSPASSFEGRRADKGAGDPRSARLRDPEARATSDLSAKKIRARTGYGAGRQSRTKRSSPRALPHRPPRTRSWLPGRPIRAPEQSFRHRPRPWARSPR